MIFNSITMTDVIIRLLAALLMGAAIGFERQWRQRMAGLRTNALVAIGACLFVILAVVTPVMPARQELRLRLSQALVF